MKEHTRSELTVFVVDHLMLRPRTVKELFEFVGLKVNLLTSGSAFLEAPIPDTRRRWRRCGAARHERPKLYKLARAELHVPSLVFLTAHGDIRMAVGAIKVGGSRSIFRSKPTN